MTLKIDLTPYASDFEFNAKSGSFNFALEGITTNWMTRISFQNSFSGYQESSKKGWGDWEFFTSLPTWEMGEEDLTKLFNYLTEVTGIGELHDTPEAIDAGRFETCAWKIQIAIKVDSIPFNPATRGGQALLERAVDGEIVVDKFIILDKDHVRLIRAQYHALKGITPLPNP
jgi:hypothetical protein